MKIKLDYNLLEDLYSQDKSYKEIASITGYSENSVNGYFWRTKGKMTDSKKFRRNNIDINQEQKEILFGTLMGDGNIQKQYTNSYLGRFNHSIKQLDYCTYLQNKLSGITTNVKEYSVKNKNGKEYQCCYFSLKNNYQLKEFYDLFYINGKKDIPYDLNLLTPKAMAYWFMDDGSARSGCTISIATCSFSIEALIRIKQYLSDVYGLNVTINKEFKLDFSAESARKFYQLTKEYIIPEMMYKFKFINTAMLI